MEHTPRKVPPQSAPSRSAIWFDRSGEEEQQFAERRTGALGEKLARSHRMIVRTMP